MYVLQLCKFIFNTKFEPIVQLTLFKYMYFWCIFLGPNPTTYHLNMDVHLKQVTTLSPLILNFYKIHFQHVTLHRLF